MSQTIGLVIAGSLFLLWLLSLQLRNSSIVDIFWGCGFVMIAWLAFIESSGDASRRYLVVGLATLWGLRLSGYLASRNIGHGEDPRYRAMREKHGAHWWWRSAFIVFGLQGVLMLIVSLPLQFAQISSTPLGPFDALAAAVTLAGIAFESAADFQLARFKKNPANRGQVLKTGVWRYTRHPNYFGDFLVWWGLWGVAAAAGYAQQTLVSPLVMSFLLTRVSGVPLLEKAMKQKPGYADYVARTSSFFPWWPREK